MEKGWGFGSFLWQRKRQWKRPSDPISSCKDIHIQKFPQEVPSVLQPELLPAKFSPIVPDLLFHDFPWNYILNHPQLNIFDKLF